MSERIYQVIIGVLVLIILVGGALMLSGRSSVGAQMGSETSATSSDDSSGSMVDVSTSMKADNASKSTTGKTTASTVAGQGDELTVGDQSAGNRVTVKSVTISKLGWLAVRDSKGGWILGAERVEAGTHSNVSISLLRSTVAGKSYEVVLFADNGDKVFDLHKDSLIMNADGNPASAAFLAK